MKPYVLVLGHACAAGEAPANTLAGVRACIDAGVEGMEIDVQLCADGVPVLMHDDTVDRTTNLHGPVREKTLAELQAADAGDGEPVPTLDQVLALVAGRFTVMCELKATPDAPDQDQACVDAVVEVIRRHNAESWTAIHSFNPIMVERARATEPRISATIITGQIRGEVVDRLLGGLMKRHGQAISVEHHVVDRTLIEKAKKRQVTVWTWTVDKPEDWARVVEAGVDGIITNVPHRLREWLNQL
ncbi:MAG TPA: glycerophosphodiester phosphodiesterase [Tepidiformaceae bacterium]|nr:glycerophosphodiester phosphodiesterase [Tepidiformaceae bacterium]